ncbi:replication-associated recombination protein A [Streptobacillus moniliformis]|uniref:AAA ATPase central domain protein n=1 Tax=Streptobacillus moniliformis (strain ATCC 14647 / DSM 12112 / NCTC 10651 / 9901) TaxID=519441 RepID=D1AYA7_STRM9|nr:replication-associated recombination protein A [Streptobacillus moniliformis]ACZ01283.1 AAA ATPase central domain protein [Streptobacillus moniliformis DSM 12112]AVL42362.1 replication-associated recombination protein A [Streptobacillus moniliformis]SQA13559.1 Replication-associated recombination protein A [Streptobacillus moniliformis]
MNLFNYDKEPLAYKYRPKDFDEFYGQENIRKILFRMLENNKIISSIFFGPSGTGKTTLAKIIADKLGYDYVYLNAIKASKNDITQISLKAKNSVNKTLLFFDEIHRFNKLQQDSLLEDLENGNIILIGATTENPYFSLNRALLSRVLLFEFKKLDEEDIFNILEKIAKEEQLEYKEDILKYISMISDGDARTSINFLETLINADFLNSSIEEVTELFNIKVFADRYDAISAMIKSIRGSDPDSAVYWMSKLLIGGEAPMYIARRLVISASEDIGLANVQAINVAVSCMNAVKEIGMPESRIILSECAIYLALSPKSNSAYMAINKSMLDIEENGAQSVPVHLTKIGAKKYLYPHDYENNYVNQKYMNEKKKYYIPGNNKFEKNMEETWIKIKGEK